MASQQMPEAMGLFALGTWLFFVLAVMAVSIAIFIAVILIVQSFYKRIPPEHRKMEPGMVWLLLIPCFSIIWNFFVFLRLSDSFKSYFDSQGIEDVGDCNRTLALAYCIATVLCLVPCLNYVAGPVTIVLLVLVMVKYNELKNRIPAAS
ncbi:MAG: hypothetical protein ACOX5J_02755 [Candidatus Hydrogenedentales bacterium]|jgi:hypothetical protein